ncbi:Ppx/GppA family phosphatase [Frigidibacter sp. ROC022]|uniref:Ppx/GppA family phosphatase n=1 Tax=Frigidibacter sp. ROC022 TaxID=2971796 RepID=UPI00215ABF59|nr:Ppx/GppA family phosphatase [Frigidibacter sp. ROC022]MCR8722977.1 Ppx/GppA family phosphatase [Frigidibacter sp. ROC022]
MDGQSDQTAEDWGPFGRPLFADPQARALSRIGVVDVGSNSVRLVVFDGAARSPAYFYNEKILCGLGAGLAETGRLNPEGKARTIDALRRFQILAEGMGIAPLTAVATAAVRDAADGPEFRETVLRETGLALYVIDGEEEARLSAQGVLLGWPEADGLVCDIGGSSMELAEVHDGAVGRRLSSPLGPLKLQGFKGSKKALRGYIADVMQDLAARMGRDNKRIFLVGGSWRAIARIDMLRRSYPLTVLHEYRMSPADAKATVAYIAKADMAKLGNATSTSMARLSLVPLASEVLLQLLRTFKPREIAVSSYGIREGMLYQQMPARLRRRDPLIEACRFAEVKDARMPGFGRALYEFLLPVFPGFDKRHIRLMKAACLLHDVSWRAHPDFRHEVCFENATRANLGGLTHQERIFLGLALMHRYKNSRAGSRHSALFGLLDEAEIKSAERLGKAIRFGAMFAIDDPLSAGKLKLFPRKKVLQLALNTKGRGLFGEVASSRLASLASSLGATVSVVDV